MMLYQSRLSQSPIRSPIRSPSRSISSSGRRGVIKGLRVKYLVQLVVVTVLFTWFLYQLSNSHKPKVLARDEIDQEMLFSADNGQPWKLSSFDQLVEDGNMDELIDAHSLLKSRKMLLRPEVPLDTPEFEQALAERDTVEDVVADDGGDREDENGGGVYVDLLAKRNDERDKKKREERERREKRRAKRLQKKRAFLDDNDDPDALFYKRSAAEEEEDELREEREGEEQEEEEDRDLLIHGVK